MPDEPGATHQIYFLKDAAGEIRCRITCHGDEEPELESWMQHNINNSGWALEMSYSRTSVASVHGHVDWESVADSLALSLRTLTDENTELDEAQTEQALEDANSALVDYDVAHMEASLGRAQEGEEEDEDAGA